MKIQIMSWLCDKHTSELMDTPMYKSNSHFLWQYHGKVQCQEKDCSLSANYQVYIWIEIRGRKARS